MKYLCLVYLEDQKLHAVSDTECLACGGPVMRRKAWKFWADSMLSQSFS